MTTSARADFLWYNGDADGRDQLANATNLVYNNSGVTTSYSSLVYDNFVVPVGQTWTVTSVFSNDQFYFNNGSFGSTLLPSTATWQIRSGVSSGVGGTIVASGDTAATLTPGSAPVINNGYSEYKVSATVPSITLVAGTYWLAVAPDDPKGTLLDFSGVETTSGANAIGTPPGNDDSSFITNTLPASTDANSFFTPTSVDENKLGLTGNFDYSMGVVGSFTVSVPEPTSFVLTLIAILGLSVPAIRQLRQRTTPVARVLATQELSHR